VLATLICTAEKITLYVVRAHLRRRTSGARYQRVET
jgi:hypothetical protein